MSAADVPRGWQLLHSKLPKSAIKELATAVYGVAGLSDVNEGYLIQRLFASELMWEWRIVKQEYLGFEDRLTDKGKQYRVYMAAVQGELYIQGRAFHGSGASDNRKLDAAFKGAATVAFKNACKVAGLTAELYLDGRAIDHIYSERVGKDKEMVREAPPSVDELVAEIEETFGPPEEVARSEREGKHVAVSAPAMTDAPPPQEAQDVAPRPAGGPAIVGPHNGSTTPASPEPLVPDPDDRQPLYMLARTLKHPRTAVEVDAKIAKLGLGSTRLELIMAHGRDCQKSPCEHVAALAGLLVTK